MDRHSEQSRSSSSVIRPDKNAPQKLNISYLLNDPTNEDKCEQFMRDTASSRDLRVHRSKSVAGSSRRLHVPPAVRERIDRLERNGVPAPPVQAAPQPTHACLYCNQVFQHVSLLEEHKQTHQNHHLQNYRHQRLRSFVCDECGANFSEKGNLNKKEKPWPCQYCNNNFAFRDALNRHINAVHLDLRPYSCTQCVAKFKKRAHLQRHMSTCHRSSSSTQPQ